MRRLKVDTMIWLLILIDESTSVSATIYLYVCDMN